MPEVGRFGQVDPVTETQENYSLYQYGWGNPVLRSDPNGDCPLCPAIPFMVEGIKSAIIAGAAVYTASKLGQELSKGTFEIPAGGASNNSSVPMWVQQKSKQMNKSEANSPETGKRRSNRIPDTGKPNSTEANKPGTTIKKYGPNGVVQKEFNKGHKGEKIPGNEKKDHVHDHKPKENSHPNDPQKTERQKGRPLKKGELVKDFNQKKDT